MDHLKKIIYKEVLKSQRNNYGRENFDEYRFGPYPSEAIQITKKKNSFSFRKFKKQLKRFLKVFSKTHRTRALRLVDDLIGGEHQKLSFIWENLSYKDKNLFIKLLVFRILGFQKVKLPMNNFFYWEALEKAETMGDSEETYDPKFLHFVLKKFDLSPIGYNINFFFTEKGVATDFIIEQYAYKSFEERIVAVEKGDTVLDLGGCWGDTALYFAHHIGENGKVYTFEFIPGNLNIMEMNIQMNPLLKEKIEVIQKPVTEESGKCIFFKDNGPGSIASFKPFENFEGTCESISIDDFVRDNNISKVDFIKMDIEGAEQLALKGAVNTIKKYKPKLAIAIYHSFDDFINIPNWILHLDLGYEIFIGHYTIHAEETVCFAKPKE